MLYNTWQGRSKVIGGIKFVNQMILKELSWIIPVEPTLPRGSLNGGKGGRRVKTRAMTL